MDNRIKYCVVLIKSPQLHKKVAGGGEWWGRACPKRPAL